MRDLRAIFVTLTLFFSVMASSTVALSQTSEPAERRYYVDERGAERLYSRAVATTGGTTIWLAGQTVLEDAGGNPIPGDFDAQTREAFRLIGEHLEQFGGTLADIVTMTVYTSDVRNADRYLDIKRDVFGDGPYPSSAFIGVYGFSRPGVVVEVKATAVVD